MKRPPLAQLFAYADRRLGIFTIADADRFGVTQRMLDYRLAQHIIERVQRGVFRVVGAHDEWHQRVVAALARCGPNAVASHRTAAALHRFDGFSPGPIDIVIPVNEKRVAAGATVRRMTLEPRDRCKVGVIPATSPVRTMIDLGSAVEEGSLVSALDSAERDGKVQRRALTNRLHELRGHGGTATLRQVLARREEVGHTPRTVLERAFLDLLAAHGLPLPVCQYGVARLDGRTAFLDFAYPDRLLAIETDGNGSHATPAQRAADNQRSNELPGWRVVRFTYEQLMEQPGETARTVGLHLRS